MVKMLTMRGETKEYTCRGESAVSRGGGGLAGFPKKEGQGSGAYCIQKYFQIVKEKFMRIQNKF